MENAIVPNFNDVKTLFDCLMANSHPLSAETFSGVLTSEEQNAAMILLLNHGAKIGINYTSFRYYIGGTGSARATAGLDLNSAALAFQYLKNENVVLQLGKGRGKVLVITNQDFTIPESNMVLPTSVGDNPVISSDDVISTTKRLAKALDEIATLKAENASLKAKIAKLEQAAVDSKSLTWQ